MFVQRDVCVPLPVATAEAGLRRLVTGDGLHVLSEAAYGRGIEVFARVGPIGGVTKQVRVRWLEPHRSGRTLVFPLRWEATGPSGGLFPTLDANLGLTEVDASTTLLSIVGTYHPPLGGVGEQLDRLVLHRAAQATLQSLMRQIGKELVREAEATDGDGAAAEQPAY